MTLSITHSIPLILAENFDGLFVWILGLPVVLAVSAAVSFFGAARGHWSGPALAGPAVGIGGLLFLSVAAGGAPCAILLITLAPPAVGIGALGLWAERRRGRQ
jgi:hypothetical protein